MDAERLGDLISRGMGVAARMTGDDYDVFRTRSFRDPVIPRNRIMRLPVVLENAPVGGRRPRGFERVMLATCDWVRMLPGDYLRGPRGTLFVALIPPMERPICVLTNKVVSVLRSSGPSSAGLNCYGGVVEDSLELVLSGWPVQSMLVSGTGQGALPADGGRSAWSIVFPPTPVPPKASDLLQDEFGRRYLVRSCDESEMGWHLSVSGTEV